jgi:tetratricopeptide (TPR) repeat protein
MLTLKIKPMKILFCILCLCFSKAVFAQSAADYYEEALALYDKKNYTAALAKLEKTMKLDASKVDYYAFWAEINIELKNYRDAYSIYGLALEKFPEESLLYNNRANLLLKLRGEEDAIKDYTQAIKFAKADSFLITYLSNRAGGKISIMDYKGGYKDLMEAYKLDSTNLAVLTNLGMVCDEVGRGEETLKYLIKVVELDSLYFPAYINIGFKYQHLNRHEEAVDYFNQALEISPEEPLGYSNRSFSKLQLGQLNAAMKDIDKSIKLYPGNSYAYKIRALIWLEKNKTAKACENLEMAITQGYTDMYGDEVLDLQIKHCEK